MAASSAIEPLFGKTSKLLKMKSRKISALFLCQNLTNFAKYGII